MSVAGQSPTLRGTLPAILGEQIPNDAGAAQSRQPSSQAESQQTPSTQNPLAHPAAAMQGWPSGLPSASAAGIPPTSLSSVVAPGLSARLPPASA
jgi:hypothetical protein